MRPEGDIPAGRPSELHTRSGRLSEDFCVRADAENLNPTPQSVFRYTSFRYCTVCTLRDSKVNGSLQLSLPVGMMAEIGIKKNTAAAKGTLLFPRPIFFPGPKAQPRVSRFRPPPAPVRFLRDPSLSLTLFLSLFSAEA